MMFPCSSSSPHIYKPLFVLLLYIYVRGQEDLQVLNTHPGNLFMTDKCTNHAVRAFISYEYDELEMMR